MQARQDGKFSMFKIIRHPFCDSRRGPWIVLSREHQSRATDLLERILHDRIRLNERRVCIGVGLEIIRQQFAADRFDPFRELLFKRLVEPPIHGSLRNRSKTFFARQLQPMTHADQFFLGPPVHSIHQHQCSQAGRCTAGKGLADHASHRQPHQMHLCNVQVRKQVFQLLNESCDVFDRVGLRPSVPQHVVAQYAKRFFQRRHLRLPHGVIQTDAMNHDHGDLGRSTAP